MVVIQWNNSMSEKTYKPILIGKLWTHYLWSLPVSMNKHIAQEQINQRTRIENSKSIEAFVQ